MGQCNPDRSWFSYFKENMNDLGLDVPTSWFGNATKTTSYLAALVAVTENIGSKITINELLGAASKGERLMVAGAVYASFYLGAAIGSAAVATGRSTSCGTEIIDVLIYAKRNKLYTNDIGRVLRRHSEIYNTSIKSRRIFALKGKVAA